MMESAVSVGKKIAHTTGRHESGQERSVAMTPRQHRTDVGRHQTPPEHTPRLRLKPKAPQTGYVDGAWWPRSDDLTTELPDLLAVLSVRLGPIDRVLYKLSDWAKAPAKLATGGRAVRLDGFRLQPPNTVEVLGLNRNRIALLVVPPHTDPDHAHATMMAAAGPNNVSTVGGLFMAGEPDRETGTQTAAAQERWDSEGGAER
jgi:Family of unknown function (DUF5994)